MPGGCVQTRSETLYLKTKRLIKLQYIYKLNSNLEMVAVKIVVRIELCSGVCTPWMIWKWYWEFETQPQNWATGWWVWQLQTSICRRVKGSFFFSFISLPPSHGNLERASFQVLLHEVATKSVCSFCSPGFDDRCWIRHPSSFSLPPTHACQPPTLLMLCGESAWHDLWAGLDRASVIRHRDFQSPPTTKWMCGSYPSHAGNTPGIASAASGGSVLERVSIGTIRLWAFLFCFSKRTKKAWVMSVLYLSRLICGFCWLSDHLALFLYY